MARGHMLFLGSAGVVIPRAVAGMLHVRGHVPDLGGCQGITGS